MIKHFDLVIKPAELSASIFDPNLRLNPVSDNISLFLTKINEIYMYMYVGVICVRDQIWSF